MSYIVILMSFQTIYSINYGATQGGVAAVNKVLRVGVSAPVEMNEFWSTESMGVEIKPCMCEVEKLTQVEGGKEKS